MRYWLLALAIALAVITLPGRTQPAQSSLLLRIGPECVIVNAATTLTDHPDDGMLSGVTTFIYKLRSSGAGGAAIQLALDRPGVPFNYVVRLAANAAASGSQVIPASGLITVAQFGGDSHSSKAGDTGSISWSVPADSSVPAPRVSVSISCR